MLSDARIRPLVKLLYVAVVLILYNQITEILAGFGQNPVDPGSAEWRLRLFGVLATRAGWIVVADALLFAAVIRLDDRRGLRVLGWFNLVLGLAAAGCVAFLAHDGLVLRNSVPGQVIGLAVLRSGVPLALVMVIALYSGWGSIRKSRKPDWGGRNRPTTPLFTDTVRAESPRRRVDD